MPTYDTLIDSVEQVEHATLAFFLHAPLETKGSDNVFEGLGNPLMTFVVDNSSSFSRELPLLFISLEAIVVPY